MATTIENRAAEIPAPQPDPGLWLHNKTYDLAWYGILPFALAAFMPLVAQALGPTGAFQVYIMVAVLTGLPHNMITWLLIMPVNSRGYYQPGVLFVPFVLTSLVLAPMVAAGNTPLFAWGLSIVTMVAYYHVVRQHIGLLHSADQRYVKATGDASIRQDSRELRWMVGTVATALAAWKMYGPPLNMGYALTPVTFTFQPIPLALPLVATGAALAMTARAGWAFWRRKREGKRFPAVHALIALPALGTIAFADLLPAQHFFLTLAIISAYHNLQYFGFCYTHHHLRAQADPAATDPFSNWARNRDWRRWFALPVALGIAFICAVALLPPFWQVVMDSWIMVSHYFVDGNIWRRKYYPQMGRFANNAVHTT